MDPVTGEVLSFDQAMGQGPDQLLAPFRSILGLPFGDQVRACDDAYAQDVGSPHGGVDSSFDLSSMACCAAAGSLTAPDNLPVACLFAWPVLFSQSDVHSEQDSLESLGDLSDFDEADFEEFADSLLQGSTVRDASDLFGDYVGILNSSQMAKDETDSLSDFENDDDGESMTMVNLGRDVGQVNVGRMGVNRSVSASQVQFDEVLMGSTPNKRVSFSAVPNDAAQMHTANMATQSSTMWRHPKPQHAYHEISSAIDPVTGQVVQQYDNSDHSAVRGRVDPVTGQMLQSLQPDYSMAQAGGTTYAAASPTSAVEGTARFHVPNVPENPALSLHDDAVSVSTREPAAAETTVDL